MENPEEILHSLEEFSKLKPKDIPRELEDYLSFVAKTGDPIYQWSTVKSLFREKLINVITEFYEACPSIDIPPCPNVDAFHYETMKSFILEKFDTFSAAPFTVQRICELLTAPRKQYNRIDKYMRALEKNILVVSTTEPGNNRRSTENGDGIMNGLESEHLPESSNSNDINVEEMDDSPSWPRIMPSDTNLTVTQHVTPQNTVQDELISESRSSEASCSSSADTVITCRNPDEPYVSIEPVVANTCRQGQVTETDVSVTITAIPAMDVHKIRNGFEPAVASNSKPQEEQAESKEVTTSEPSDETKESTDLKEKPLEDTSSTEPSEEEKNVDSTSQNSEVNTKLQMEIEQKEESEKDVTTPSNKEIEETAENTSSEAEYCVQQDDTPTESLSSNEVADSKEEDEVTTQKDVDDKPLVDAPDSGEVVKETQKTDDFEENSKDSEVSSSSSVASNEESPADDSVKDCDESDRKASGDQGTEEAVSEKAASPKNLEQESVIESEVSQSKCEENIEDLSTPEASAESKSNVTTTEDVSETAAVTGSSIVDAKADDAEEKMEVDADADQEPDKADTERMEVDDNSQPEESQTAGESKQEDLVVNDAL